MIGCLSGVSLQHGTETAHWPTEQCPYHTIEAPLVFLSSNYFCAVAVILGIVLLVFLRRVAFYNWAVRNFCCSNGRESHASSADAAQLARREF